MTRPTEPTGSLRNDSVFRAGWDYARLDLAGEPKPIREQAARDAARGQQGLSPDSVQYRVYAGVLSYLREMGEES